MEKVVRASALAARERRLGAVGAYILREEALLKRYSELGWSEDDFTERLRLLDLLRDCRRNMLRLRAAEARALLQSSEVVGVFEDGM